ncbi:MAG: universal stress protein, partial [Dehalococcoidia bacterium]
IGRQMEKGLPAKYQQEGELQRQRALHGTLITRGLETISQSYLDYFENECRDGGVSSEGKMAEGQNYVEILRELDREDYGLLVMGFLGLGAVERSIIGTVCERVLRRARTDVLVVKKAPSDHGKIVVAIDGSPQSFQALERGLTLGEQMGTEIEVIAAYDPHFHNVAFQSIAGVLSEEAGRDFHFEAQEKLHDQIINSGLEKIYGEHLQRAQQVARGRGQEVGTVLLTGKPFEEILNHVTAGAASFLIVGRFGTHHSEYADIGGTAENLVRLARCNVLVVNGEASLKGDDPARHRGRKAATPETVQQKHQKLQRGGHQGKEDIAWTEAAEAKMRRAPEMVRLMVVKSVEDLARERGLSRVTPELIDEAKSLWEKEGFSHP